MGLCRAQMCFRIQKRVSQCPRKIAINGDSSHKLVKTTGGGPMRLEGQSPRLWNGLIFQECAVL